MRKGRALSDVKLTPIKKGAAAPVQIEPIAMREFACTDCGQVYTSDITTTLTS